MTVGLYADLRGKSILVTGASSGIGAAVADHLAMQGARLFLTGRDERRLQDVAKEGAIPAIRLTADLCSGDDRLRLMDDLELLDGICHCAGITDPVPVSFLTEDRVAHIMDINFQVPVLITSSLLRRKKIRRGGSLVFMSSVAATFGYKGGGVYAASKAALDAYCRSVAIEHGGQGIRANSIRAGMVKTPMYEKTTAFCGDIAMSTHERRYPLGVGLPTDVASLVLFLLSDASRWMSGSCITLDGGLTSGE